MAVYVREVLGIALRLLIGMVFLVAAADKLSNPELFARNIANYRILPTELVNIPALVIPWLEVLVGLMLIVGLRVRAAATVAVGLLLVFTLALISALVRGLDIHCGCFSQTAAERIGWERVVQDIALLVGAFLLALWTPHRWGVEEYLQRES
ncbi:MAG: DoxX family membrane protein [Candidatus Kapabacteria bacterium]|nr:DoxX family membrane protein [Candidatus Kapabacteria bacterium]MDW8225293.1 MauE/DoxX family redox-associated membrane protein [Bacteroidota bacterium]